jgi:hypothetical protein
MGRSEQQQRQPAPMFVMIRAVCLLHPSMPKHAYLLVACSHYSFLCDGMLAVHSCSRAADDLAHSLCHYNCMCMMQASTLHACISRKVTNPFSCSTVAAAGACLALPGPSPAVPPCSASRPRATQAAPRLACAARPPRWPSCKTCSSTSSR